MPKEYKEASQKEAVNTPGVRNTRSLFWAFAAFLFLFATFFAVNQSPRPNPFKPVKTFSPDWWRYPVEQNAFARLPSIGADLNDLFVLPGTDKIWAVGDGGLIIHSSDGGQTWQRQTIQLGDVSTPEGAAALKKNTIAAEQGKDSTEQQFIQKTPKSIKNPSNTLPEPTQKEEVPSQKVIPQSPPSEGTSPLLMADLYAVHFVDEKRGWAVGRRGTILATNDGGQNWQPQTSGTDTSLRAVYFVDEKRGWAVGGSGTILATNDGGVTWRAQISGTNAFLSDVHFSEGKRGWIVGEARTILTTEDGGKVWETIRYARKWLGLAPWYFCLFVLFFGFVVAEVRRPVTDAKAERSIADAPESDRPLQTGDPDPLQFGTIAKGLSRFLRNKATEPPLTLAITGAWGTGKSSLMNLLKEDLAARGFQPVWFNAWHHQKEEHLLASLLESIRKQAIPHWFHWTRWRFGPRLLLQRGKVFLTWVILLLLLFAYFIGYFWADPQRWEDAKTQTLIAIGFKDAEQVITAWSLEKLKKKAGLPEADIQLLEAVKGEIFPDKSALVNRLKTLKIGNKETLTNEFRTIVLQHAERPGHPDWLPRFIPFIKEEGGTLLTAMGSLLIFLVTILNGAAGMGLNPAGLLRALSRSGKAGDLKAQIGFRHRFG